MKFLVLLFIFAPATVWADMLFSCDYAYLGMPTTSIEALIYTDGSPAPTVKVSMQGRTHQETATREVLAADEAAHLWISKENPENTIEMVIYRADRPNGNSVLINHNVPFGKEMWGKCVATASLIN